MKTKLILTIALLLSFSNISQAGYMTINVGGVDRYTLFDPDHSWDSRHYFTTWAAALRFHRWYLVNVLGRSGRL